MSPCPRNAGVGRRLGRVSRVIGLVGLASLMTWGAACGSDARGKSQCQQIESARCDKLATDACGGLPGGADSCERFYDVQCQRGLADDATETTAAELKKCLDAIAISCDVARAPETFAECKFLNTTNPPEAGLDTGAESATDTGSEAAAETSTETSAETSAEASPDAIGDTAAEAANDAGADADEAG
jgi:hypothetical protein